MNDIILAVLKIVSFIMMLVFPLLIICMMLTSENIVELIVSCLFIIPYAMLLVHIEKESE